MPDKTISRREILSLTTEIVSAYAGNNSVEHRRVPEFLQTVFKTLSALSDNEITPAVSLVPAVPIKKSVGADYLICLEDGKKRKILKRHLRTFYDLTPEQYRARWGLPGDYPMVAPHYALRRREIALKTKFGHSKTTEMDTPEPELSPKPRARRKAA